jgi:hypothetical protein
MPDPFAAPGSAGSGITLADHKGALLVVDVRSVEVGVVTMHGTSDAVRCDISVIDGPGAPAEYSDSLIFGKVLIGQLRARVGQKVLGRLGQGAATPGKSPAWILVDATDADKRIGAEWIAKGMVSAGSVDDQRPPF